MRARYAGLAGAIVVFCLLLIAVIWWSTLQRIEFERVDAIANELRESSNLVMAFEEQTIRTLKAAEQVAKFVRHEYLAQGEKMNMGRYTERGMVEETIFTVISVVNAHGELLLSTVPAARASYADRDFFTHHLRRRSDDLYISKPVLGRISGTWQIPMSIRIDRPDGSFGGVVVLSVNPAYFTGFYQKAELGRQGVVALAGLDGTIRARRAGRDNSYGESFGGSEVFAELKRNPVGSYTGSDGLDAVRRIYSYRTLAEYPLVAMVGAEEEEVMAGFLQRALDYRLAAGLASTLIVIFAALMLAALARQRRVIAALGDSEAQFRATFNQAAMGIAHTAPDGRFLRANQKLCDMLGYTESELLALGIQQIAHPDDAGQALAFLRQLFEDDARSFTPEMEMRWLCKDRSVIWVSIAAGLVRDAAGRPDYLVAVAQDISARKELQQRLAHQAHHDSLTQLPNRMLTYDRLEQALVRARRRRRIVGFLFIDLDGFKLVNDSLGHGCGDQLLQQAAARLTQCVRAEDTVGRLGGDEFAIVLSEMPDARDCAIIAGKVLAALAEPFPLGEHMVHITASAGIAAYPQDGVDVDTLVYHADAAMFLAKKAGKNNYRFHATEAGA